MALLDFIKNRQSQEQTSQQSQQQKPETAREMYSRQAQQEQTGQTKVEQLSQADKSAAKELGARLDKATQHIRQDAANQATAPTDGAASPQPMRQNMLQQDHAAPSLSPTSAQRGQTQEEARGNAPAQEGSQSERQATQQRPQTISRTTPSWER